MIDLPRPPKQKAELKYISFGVDVDSAYGGPNKRINRLGDRYSYSVVLKARGNQGAPVIALINKGRRELVRMPVNQAVDYPATNLTVKTGVSGGSVIALQGTGDLKAGQLITLYGPNNKQYLHMVYEDVTITAAGTNVQLTPMIRGPINAGSHVETQSPTITGWLTGKTTEWTINEAKIVEVELTITEAE